MNRSAPQVSVIMNCLNCARYVREAIASVYAQTYPNWEIVFWDNASTDCSADIVREFDDRVRYFRGERSVPLGQARNFALRQARGEFIAFLDCDDVWMPEKLEWQVPAFDDAEVGLVYSNTLFFNEASRRSRALYRRSSPPQGWVFEALLSDYFLSLETVTIRRRVLDGLSKWFDDRFNLIEEADLFVRIAHDWKICYVPLILARWRLHGEGWTWTRGHLFAEELRMMLGKYEALYPEFAVSYARPIRRLNARIAYYEAVEHWKQDRRAVARRLLGRHLRVMPRFLVPYAFSFFPFGLYRSLLRSLVRAA